MKNRKTKAQTKIAPTAPAAATARPAPSTLAVTPAIGMRVEFMLDGSGPRYGEIIHICPDACVVLMEESRYGAHGRDITDQDAEWVAALDWSEVLITNVRPSQPTKPVKCIVRPGMRAQVSVNDGNSDMDGTVIGVYPRCVVVELDERTKNDSGKFAACEWDRVTMLNIGVEGGAEHAD